MSWPELLARTGALVFCYASLGLAAWAAAELALPRPSPIGLRWLALLAGQMVLTAILVQSLGLLGLLQAPWLLAACLAAGGAGAAALSRQRPGRPPLISFARFLGRSFRLIFVAPGFLLGGCGLLILLYLGATFFALPRDVDALAMHGPLVAEWIGSGRVAFDSRWNYPLGWEYQLTPPLLLLRSDALVIAPALAAVLALLLALRELGKRLGLGALAAQWASLLCLASPVIWREPMKSDPAFALAQLLGILAVERAARGGRGAYWLLQLALFLTLGFKASGFFYAALLALAYALALLWRRRRRREHSAAAPAAAPRSARVAGAVLLTAALQLSAAAVQVRNFAEHGNPMYPLQWRVGPLVVFAGPSDAGGTAMLDAPAAAWRSLIAGGRIAAGREWPALLVLLGAAMALGWLDLRRFRPPARRGAAAALGGAALLLWAIFAATPWVLGLAPGTTQYLESGQSLRFAIAPLGLTYLLAAAPLARALGRRRLGRLLPAIVLPLVFWKWSGFGIYQASWPWLGGLAAAAAGVALLPRAAAAAGRVFAWLPRAAPAAALLLAIAGLAFFARRVETAVRPAWLPAYRTIWQAVWYEIPPGSTIVLNDGRALFRYLLYGPRFENRLQVAELGRLGQPADPPAGSRYLYYFVGPAKSELPGALGQMQDRGWRVIGVAGDGRGALLGRP